MFGIGPMELVVIAIVAIIFIGPEKLPETMRKLGRFFVQARRHANDVKSSFQEVIHDAEREIEMEKIREFQQKLQSTSPSQIIETTVQSAMQTNTTGHDTQTEHYDYHESHYVDGKYQPGEGFQPVDPFANVPLSELLGPPKNSAQTSPTPQGNGSAPVPVVSGPAASPAAPASSSAADSIPSSRPPGTAAATPTAPASGAPNPNPSGTFTEDDKSPASRKPE